MESLADDLATQVRKRLDPEHIAAMQSIGSSVEVSAGDKVLAVGDAQNCFNLIEEGTPIQACSPSAMCGRVRSSGWLQPSETDLW